MIGSLFAGISGLNANATAMTVVGHNIANVNTDGFKKNRATFQTGQNGGVRVEIRRDESLGFRYDVTENGETVEKETSNVDLTEQLVKLIEAQRNFQANAQVIQTADTITQTIINIR